MSALAMILMAAMMAPGDGPEKVSGEIAQQKLDLSGRWGGWMKGARDASEVPTLNLKKWNIIDEGAGRLRLKIQGVTRYGIYEQQGDRLKICFASAGKPRPTRFEGSEDQCLLDLHRINSSE